MKQKTYSKRAVEEIMCLCRDNGDYPFVINKEDGLDFVIPDAPHVKVRKPEKYIARLDIRTWVDLDENASHYYGTLIANSPELYMIGNMGEESVGGYVSKIWSSMTSLERKFIGVGYKINVCRRVTEDDIKNQPARYVGYKVGDKTEAFLVKNQLIYYAIKIVKVRFPGYRFIINNVQR